MTGHRLIALAVFAAIVAMFAATAGQDARGLTDAEIRQALANPTNQETTP